MDQFCKIWKTEGKKKNPQSAYCYHHAFIRAPSVFFLSYDYQGFLYFHHVLSEYQGFLYLSSVTTWLSEYQGFLYQPPVTKWLSKYQGCLHLSPCDYQSAKGFFTCYRVIITLSRCFLPVNNYYQSAKGFSTCHLSPSDYQSIKGFSILVDYQSTKGFSTCHHVLIRVARVSLPAINYKRKNASSNHTNTQKRKIGFLFYNFMWKIAPWIIHKIRKKHTSER